MSGSLLSVVAQSSLAWNTPDGAPLSAVARHVAGCLRDPAWQDSATAQVCAVEHSRLVLALRLFENSDVESFARYLSGDDKLVLDVVIRHQEVATLAPNEFRAELCSRLTSFISDAITKKSRQLRGIDSELFIALLTQRFQAINDGKVQLARALPAQATKGLGPVILIPGLVNRFGQP